MNSSQPFSEDKKCVLICNDSLIQSVECKDVEVNYELRSYEMQMMGLYVQKLIREEIRLEIEKLRLEIEQSKKH